MKRPLHQREVSTHLMPDNSKPPFADAQELEKRGDLPAAAKAYKADLAKFPGIAEAHHNYALLLNRLGEAKEALAQSRIAVELAPENPTILSALGQHLEATGEAEAAMNLYRQCLALNPAHLPSLVNLGRLLNAMDRPDQAVALLEPARERFSGDRGLLVNLANAYLGVGKPVEAGEAAGLAVSTAPDLAAAHNAAGIAHYIRRKWPKAAESFRHAISASPDFAEAHENLAMTLLHTGDWQQGWAEYEWRWKNPSNHLTKRALEGPVWDGTPLDGRTLLLHGEQGYGDTIQFVRFASVIKKAGGRVLLSCQTELVDLLSWADGVDDAVSLDTGLPAHDCQAPLLSLPKLLRTEPAAIPQKTPYINVPPDKAVLATEGFKIGVVWAGRSRDILDPYRNRSCRPEDLTRLARLDGVQVYSLQTGPSADDCPDGFDDLSPQIKDFTDTARLIQAMDFIVSVDTAVAHLAGGLGKPTCVALCYAADWRWGDGHGIAPWYPTVQMFRQDSPGDWAGVVGRIADMIVQKAQ